MKIDDWLGHPPRRGHPPKLSDAELLTLTLTLAVAQVLLGVRSETRRLRFVPGRLPGAFPYLPGQSGLRLHLVCTPAGLPITWRWPARKPTNGRS